MTDHSLFERAAVGWPRRSRHPRASAVPGCAVRLWRCDRGVAAVEFGLLSPIMAFVLVAGVDLGLALSERMSLDNALRAGAQSAAVEATEAQVLDVMQSTAGPNFSVAGDTSTASQAATFTADRFCACPEAPATEVACSTICFGPEPTVAYYKLGAQATHPGWILPDIDFDRVLQVQVR